MKVLSIISSLFAAVCLLLFIIAESYNRTTGESVFLLGMSDRLMINMGFWLAPFFFGLSFMFLLLWMIDRKKKKKWIPVTGMSLFFGIFLIITLVIAKEGGFESAGSLVRKQKSPDGHHAVYYTYGNHLSKSGYRVYYRRTGMFTYERIFDSYSFQDDDAAIEWKDDCFSYEGKDFEYSSYDK